MLSKITEAKPMFAGDLGRKTQAHLFSFLNGMKALSRKEYFYISLLYFNPPFLYLFLLSSHC